MLRGDDLERRHRSHSRRFAGNGSPGPRKHAAGDARRHRLSPAARCTGGQSRIIIVATGLMESAHEHQALDSAGSAHARRCPHGRGSGRGAGRPGRPDRWLNAAFPFALILALRFSRSIVLAAIACKGAIRTRPRVMIDEVRMLQEAGRVLLPVVFVDLAQALLRGFPASEPSHWRRPSHGRADHGQQHDALGITPLRSKPPVQVHKELLSSSPTVLEAPSLPTRP